MKAELLNKKQALETPSTWIQYIGNISGSTVDQLEVGSHVLWNGYGSSEVTEIIKTNKMANVFFKGSNTPRRMKLDRIIARPINELNKEVTGQIFNWK